MKILINYILFFLVSVFPESSINYIIEKQQKIFMFLEEDVWFSILIFVLVKSQLMIKKINAIS